MLWKEWEAGFQGRQSAEAKWYISYAATQRPGNTSEDLCNPNMSDTVCTSEYTLVFIDSSLIY